MIGSCLKVEVSSVRGTTLFQSTDLRWTVNKIPSLNVKWLWTFCTLSPLIPFKRRLSKRKTKFLWLSRSWQGVDKEIHFLFYSNFGLFIVYFFYLLIFLLFLCRNLTKMKWFITVSSFRNSENLNFLVFLEFISVFESIWPWKFRVQLFLFLLLNYSFKILRSLRLFMFILLSYLPFYWILPSLVLVTNLCSLSLKFIVIFIIESWFSSLITITIISYWRSFRLFSHWDS